MNPQSKYQHPWDVSPTQAKQIQQNLQRHIVTRDQLPNTIKYVAGVDVGFENNNSITRAAVAVLSFPELELLEYTVSRQATHFPYIPGLLSFREVPTILHALQKLSSSPDILVCDGQGIAHPRRFGVACHLGLLANIPSIGVAKSILVGKHRALSTQKGAQQALMDGSEKIGIALRSRTKVNPIYISAGHKISLETAADIVSQCLTRYRLPETTRWADKIASQRIALPITPTAPT